MAERPIEPDFTIGDILKEFEERFGPPKKTPPLDPNNCYSTRELMAIWGLNYDKTRDVLRGLKGEGRLIETKKDIEPLGRPGSTYPVPAYQIKEKTNGQD